MVAMCPRFPTSCVHSFPHQNGPFAPARAFSVLNPPSFSHTERKRGIVSSGNATSCNSISSSVEGTAGEHDNNTGPSELRVFFCAAGWRGLRAGNRGNRVECVVFTPPPPPPPPKIPPSSFQHLNWPTSGAKRRWHVLECGGLEDFLFLLRITTSLMEMIKHI